MIRFIMWVGVAGFDVRVKSVLAFNLLQYAQYSLTQRLGSCYSQCWLMVINPSSPPIFKAVSLFSCY